MILVEPLCGCPRSSGGELVRLKRTWCCSGGGGSGSGSRTAALCRQRHRSSPPLISSPSLAPFIPPYPLAHPLAYVVDGHEGKRRGRHKRDMGAVIVCVSSPVLTPAPLWFDIFAGATNIALVLFATLGLGELAASQLVSNAILVACLWAASTVGCAYWSAVQRQRGRAQRRLVQGPPRHGVQPSAGVSIAEPGGASTVAGIAELLQQEEAVHSDSTANINNSGGEGAIPSSGITLLSPVQCGSGRLGPVAATDSGSGRCGIALDVDTGCSRRSTGAPSPEPHRVRPPHAPALPNGAACATPVTPRAGMAVSAETMAALSTAAAVAAAAAAQQQPGQDVRGLQLQELSLPSPAATTASPLDSASRPLPPYTPFRPSLDALVTAKLPAPRAYTPFLRHHVTHVKLQGVDPSMIQPGYQERLRQLIHARTGRWLSHVYVREGCIELVLDCEEWGSGVLTRGSACSTCDSYGVPGGIGLEVDAEEMLCDAASVFLDGDGCGSGRRASAEGEGEGGGDFAGTGACRGMGDWDGNGGDGSGAARSRPSLARPRKDSTSKSTNSSSTSSSKSGSSMGSSVRVLGDVERSCAAHGRSSAAGDAGGQGGAGGEVQAVERRGGQPQPRKLKVPRALLGQQQSSGGAAVSAASAPPCAAMFLSAPAAERTASLDWPTTCVHCDDPGTPSGGQGLPGPCGLGGRRRLRTGQQHVDPVNCAAAEVAALLCDSTMEGVGTWEVVRALQLQPQPLGPCGDGAGVGGSREFSTGGTGISTGAGAGADAGVIGRGGGFSRHQAGVAMMAPTLLEGRAAAVATAAARSPLGCLLLHGGGGGGEDDGRCSGSSEGEHSGSRAMRGGNGSGGGGGGGRLTTANGGSGGDASAAGGAGDAVSGTAAQRVVFVQQQPPVTAQAASGTTVTAAAAGAAGVERVEPPLTLKVVVRCNSELLSGASLELLVRSEGRYLPAVVASGGQPPSHGGDDAAAGSDVDGRLSYNIELPLSSPHSSLHPPSLLLRPGIMLVDLRVADVPVHAAPVVVVRDPRMVSELRTALATAQLSDDDRDSLLMDLGTWVFHAAAARQEVANARGVGGLGGAGAAAGSGQGLTHGSQGALGSALAGAVPALPSTCLVDAGDESGTERLGMLGLHLLRYALAAGWWHTAACLAEDLAAMGVKEGLAAELEVAAATAAAAAPSTRSLAPPGGNPLELHRAVTADPVAMGPGRGALTTSTPTVVAMRLLPPPRQLRSECPRDGATAVAAPRVQGDSGSCGGAAAAGSGGFNTAGGTGQVRRRHGAAAPWQVATQILAPRVAALSAKVQDAQRGRHAEATSGSRADSGSALISARLPDGDAAAFDAADAATAAAPPLTALDALLVETGLRRLGSPEAAAYRTYAAPRIAAQGYVITILDLLSLAALALRGSRGPAEASSRVTLLACWVSVLEVAMQLRARRGRSGSGTASTATSMDWPRIHQVCKLLRYVSYVATKLLCALGIASMPPGIDCYVTGVAILVQEGLVHPASCLLSLPLLAVLTSLRLVANAMLVFAWVRVETVETHVGPIRMASGCVSDAALNSPASAPVDRRFKGGRIGWGGSVYWAAAISATEVLTSVALNVHYRMSYSRWAADKRRQLAARRQPWSSSSPPAAGELVAGLGHWSGVYPPTLRKEWSSRGVHRTERGAPGSRHSGAPPAPRRSPPLPTTVTTTFAIAVNNTDGKNIHHQLSNCKQQTANTCINININIINYAKARL
ncbi:hypothetical protein VOLCADRAFT_98739 [Volvox carteri f. nagariensis]|uniref:Uncharacterized protein n=1 Tax=Volvox carteri f. nagariensis TaxID=3068 RepID=D8UG60_VOLCA|nr:uncharacterized protein VOLCADRAFT_98739 [Volvox carteri f. nagariensis]EFJ41295.1 hypothetical protein VOLCADRAFT_98739 [Volvox carteri f. nagariensis]|eukprot:XP_002957629.1 hypothetical protein VOLCADRAFT_98739 [Volvox carteri f. nagariensis]